MAGSKRQGAEGSRPWQGKAHNSVNWTRGGLCNPRHAIGGKGGKGYSSDSAGSKAVLLWRLVGGRARRSRRAPRPLSLRKVVLVVFVCATRRRKHMVSSDMCGGSRQQEQPRQQQQQQQAEKGLAQLSSREPRPRTRMVNSSDGGAPAARPPPIISESAPCLPGERRRARQRARPPSGTSDTHSS